MADEIPLNDLRRILPPLGPGADERVLEVLHSGWYLNGRNVEEFEAEFGSYLGAHHVVGVGNGTDALEVALRSLDVGPGGAVATVANAGFYASTAILAVGARPTFVDISEDSLLMDPAQLDQTLAGREVSAVIHTHLYGNAGAIRDIALVCRERGVPLVEDCAQAAGAVVGDLAAGLHGDLGTFSFYPTKNLGGIGDGGAVVASTPLLGERVRRSAQYGWSNRYRVESKGRNTRLDEIQAAWLRFRLPTLNELNRRRRAIADVYGDALAESSWRLASGDTGPSHVWHLAVLIGDDITAAREHLGRLGVRTDIHYPVPDHRQPLMKGLAPLDIGGTAGKLPVTDSLTDRILTVPCFPELTDIEVERICSGLATLPD